MQNHLVEQKKLIYQPSKPHEKIWFSQTPVLLTVKFSIKLKHLTKTVIIILSVEFKEYPYHFDSNVHPIISALPNQMNSQEFKALFSVMKPIKTRHY